MKKSPYFGIVYYRPTAAENLTGAGMTKFDMAGPGLTLVLRFLINVTI